MAEPSMPAQDAAPDEVLDARVMALSAELRCLVCQNQSLADSHADLAVDLRRRIREQLATGMSEADVVDDLVARYGEFIRYRPVWSMQNAALWGGPALLAGAGLAALAFTLRRRSRLAAEAFEPEESDSKFDADSADSNHSSGDKHHESR